MICDHSAGVTMPDGRFLCFGCDDAPADLRVLAARACTRCGDLFNSLAAFRAHYAVAHGFAGAVSS